MYSHKIPQKLTTTTYHLKFPIGILSIVERSRCLPLVYRYNAKPTSLAEVYIYIYMYIYIYIYTLDPENSDRGKYIYLPF